ncbi:ribonuclease P protein subunit p20-like [Diadema setosum]|uniref:ribonuclease P protein subunit p20-like n=1 Tax=Diadema setosum TaxID=31175 RepID=UPI003B3BC65A
MASNTNKEEQLPKSKPKVDLNKSALRKRQPRRLPKRSNDIYVTRKSNFAGQLERCEKLLDAGEAEIHIHGLGAAINRALNLALQLESRALGTLQLAVSTDTVDLVDDVEPLCDDADFDVRERTNSAVHIRLFRTPSTKEESASA